jgi:mono/diheme cytochrome c family protein
MGALKTIAIVCLLFASCGDNGSTVDAPGMTDARPIDAPSIDSPAIDAPAVDGAPQACTAPGPTRGGPIAISADESTLLVTNRDAGTVTVLRVSYASGTPAMTVVAELNVGNEPWQVAIHPCGSIGWVVTRRDQKLVELTGLDGTPAVGRQLSVGSEPTALAVTPNASKVFVANWVDGTLTVVDPSTMTQTGTVDLNSTLASTGLLGSVTARPALAHPRSLAITNNGDTSDDDERVYVTEYFAQRTAPEAADASNSDTTREGLVYRVNVSDLAASVITLPPVSNTGFVDHKNGTTGCFPNQLQSITIAGGFAYVASICASPLGPVGIFQRGACTRDADCSGFGATSLCSSGACTFACTVDADCGAVGGSCNVTGGTCAPNITDVKTTTHAAVSIIDVGAGTATTTVLDHLWVQRYQGDGTPDTAARRLPLVVEDIGFGGSFGYAAANGTDAVFRFTVDTTGAITAAGAAGSPFVDLGTAGQNPIGVAVATTHVTAFTANDVTRNVSAIGLNTQTVAATTATTALPTAGTLAASQLRGKRLFGTGLDRWSLRGQGWGACQVCHMEGLSDNVTWYFARGPRQSISLDGSFASNDPTDRRIFNWTAIFDEVGDLEANVRNVSGGVGALVSTVSNPPANSDRIDLSNTTTFPPEGAAGLSGAAADAVTMSAVPDWTDVTHYLQTIRSPRRPTNLNAADVASGQQVFQTAGNCIGCHSGSKWTLSKVFYQPGGTANQALETTTWTTTTNGFPASLFPSTVSGQQMMRCGSAGAPACNNHNSSLDQLQCILRPVGTYGISPAAVNVVEVRADMVTAAQGNATNGRGYNPPSLLGLQVGAPYFHAGNARTLEEAFAATFQGHYQSPVAQVFSPTAAQISQLVSYLLSIDEDQTTFAIPALGASGGDLCHQ